MNSVALFTFTLLSPPLLIYEIRLILALSPAQSQLEDRVGNYTRAVPSVAQTSMVTTKVG